MSTARDSNRIVIAGASSLLGAELKSLLEESLFAGWDFRLVDEEVASGTLTEAGGEAAVIRPVEEDSFEKARFILFAGSQTFTLANQGLAMRSGATLIDLSGAIAGNSEASAWLPKLQSATAHPPAGRNLFFVPSALGEAVARLSVALGASGAAHVAATCFQPVSEAGKAGIEELESQTGQLLSFQSVGKPFFDAQVAFNLLDRYGSSSAHKLSATTDRVRREVSALVGSGTALPAVQVLHAPVFYGALFSAYAQLPAGMTAEALANACKNAGFVISNSEDAPSNVSAAGETSVQLAPPRSDAGVKGGWWFWGAADNIRLPAWNAVKLAEKLVG